MPIKVSVVKKEEGVFVVSPFGSIDSSNYKDLEQKIVPFLAVSTKVLVLNMSAVSYISSLGIGVILVAKKVIEEQGSSFMVVNLQPQIKLAFEIIKAIPNMRVFENLEEADKYLSEMQKKEIERRKGSFEEGK